jgi:hypothetical protein
MMLGTLVIRNTMNKGRQKDDKLFVDNEWWLYSSMQVLSQGVPVDATVNSDSSHGWA